MKYLQKFSLMLLCCSFLTCVSFAQVDPISNDSTESTEVVVVEQTPTDPVFDPSDRPDIVELTDFYNVVLGGLLMLWGFIARAFRIDKKVNDFVFVVIAGGITIAGALIWWGFADGISAVLTILTTMGIFDLLKGGANQLTARKSTVKTS